MQNNEEPLDAWPSRGKNDVADHSKPLDGPSRVSVERGHRPAERPARFGVQLSGNSGLVGVLTDFIRKFQALAAGLVSLLPRRRGESAGRPVATCSAVRTRAGRSNGRRGRDGRYGVSRDQQERRSPVDERRLRIG